MDAVSTVRDYLTKWSDGGEAACRDLLTKSHLDLNEPQRSEVLTTLYYQLLSACFASFGSTHPLPSTYFTPFVVSVLQGLPSSSSAGESGKSVAQTAFGEILVDLLWTLDAELDDLIADAKASSGASTSSEEDAEASKKALNAKKTAEQDKTVLASILRELLAGKILDITLCRQRLESSLTALAGLIPDKQNLDRREIRVRTARYYKQNKFNLLREQSEGYSKLATDIAASVGPAHDSSTGRPIETPAELAVRARSAWERAIGIIGYFDLDPNRALDVVLDVFCAHALGHWAFFIALLDCSPWARPKGSHTGAKSMDVDGSVQTPADSDDSYEGKDIDEILRIAERRAGAISPHKDDDGQRVLAQVLGFKFSWYQQPDVTEPTPRSLYLVAALLTREGFMVLEDLYPHLIPLDEKMEELHKTYLASIENRIENAKTSQLAMAAPLSDSGPPPPPRPRPSAPTPATTTPLATPAPEAAKKPAPPKEPPNQKLGLINALLAVGALRPGLALLSQHPWLVDAAPELADLLLRIIKSAVAPYHDSLLSSSQRSSASLDYAQPRTRYNGTTLVHPIPRRPQLTATAPTPPGTATIDFVYFFPDWDDRIPKCTSAQDIIPVLEPLLAFMKLHLHRDLAVFARLQRIGRTHLASTTGEDDSHPVRAFWYRVLRRYFLPALSMLRGNAVCTADMWSIVRQYEVTTRWRLYGEWQTNMHRSHPELRVCATQAERQAKDILRRLSVQTVESLSGPVAKLAHHNPTIFFRVAVNQVMAYDNLAGVVITAMRHLTNMGIDILVYVILDALSNPRKPRLKDDGVNTSDWLQSLASFTGMVFRRYNGELSAVLKYLVHQLLNRQTSEIIVLRELIWKMAGIEPLPTLSEAQISAMGGGPALRIEAVASSTRGARMDPAEIGWKSPIRIGRALMESELALPLLIQVAQQRQACVHLVNDAPLKSLAGLYDATHGVLFQYLELLNSPSVISPDDYSKKVIPPLSDLHELYGIDASICMQIIRPVLQRALLATALKVDEEQRAAEAEAKAAEAEAREKKLKAAVQAKRESAGLSRVASPALLDRPTTPLTEASVSAKTAEEMPPNTDNESQDVQMAVTSAAPAEPQSPWIPELEALFEHVVKIAPRACETLGPGFYLTFWQLSLYDIAPPMERYHEEVQTLKTLSAQEDREASMAERSQDRARRASALTHRNKRARYNEFITTLSNELKEQTVAREFTIKRLNREKHHWFSHDCRKSNVITAFIDFCVLPRCLLSPMDATFCAMFIKVMHTLGTPKFHTQSIYDKILGDQIPNIVFSCSEHEARNYGRFLLGILTDFWKWYQDEGLYNKDSRSRDGPTKGSILPGFVLRWSNNSSPDVKELATWEQQKRFLSKVHGKLLRYFGNLLSDKEFMHRYNAIIVLKELLPVFPMAAVCSNHGGHFNLALDDMVQNETRGDLKILARAYHASLLKREKEWDFNYKRAGDDVTSTKPAATAISSVSSLSVPRNQTPSGNPAIPSQAPSTISDTIKRPEVVRRVRTDAQSRSPAPPAAPTGRLDAMDVDLPPKPGTSLPPIPSHPQGSSRNQAPASSWNQNTAHTAPSSSLSAHAASESDINGDGKASSNTPNGLARAGSAMQIEPAMPPPAVPSQTPSALELREAARATIAPRASELEEGPALPPRENHSRPSSPSSRRQSPSPATRPGTRSQSADSRASDKRSSQRESRLDRDPSVSGRDPNSRSERESDRRSRRNRSKERERRHKDKDKDRDRTDRSGRDKDGDRDRDRGDRDREREKDKERVRDRDRDHGDRHRRDEKTKERKDRDSLPRTSSAVPPPTLLLPDDRSLPPRPGRRAPSPDDGAGSKRRRSREDDSPRGGKRRGQREERRDESSRRGDDRDERSRGEYDRHRKGRESETDIRSGLPETPTDRRPPTGPAGSKPSGVPSAPRAMNTPELRTRDQRELRDTRDTRDVPRDTVRESPRDNRDTRDMREFRDNRDVRERETWERNAPESRDVREVSSHSIRGAGEPGREWEPNEATTSALKGPSNAVWPDRGTRRINTDFGGRDASSHREPFPSRPQNGGGGGSGAGLPPSSSGGGQTLLGRLSEKGGEEAVRTPPPENDDRREGSWDAGRKRALGEREPDVLESGQNKRVRIKRDRYASGPGHFMDALQAAQSNNNTGRSSIRGRR